MENSSGRKAAMLLSSGFALPRLAPPGLVSSGDPVTESLPPARVPRLPAEVLARLLVRRAARGGHLGHDELPGEQPPEPGGHAQRRLRACDPGQVREPVL